MSVDIPPGGTRGAKAPPRGAVGRMLMGVARRVHRLTGSKMSGRPLLYLTTVGAKSGQPRTAVVMPFPEGDGAWLIVASANGAARHPAWLHNLAAHPDRVEIELEGRKTAVTPQTLSGEERATAWERITRERPSFAEYELKTDRDIPVVRLVARARSCTERRNASVSRRPRCPRSSRHDSRFERRARVSAVVRLLLIAQRCHERVGLSA